MASLQLLPPVGHSEGRGSNRLGRARIRKALISLGNQRLFHFDRRDGSGHGTLEAALTRRLA